MPQRVAHTLEVQQECMHSGSVEFAVDYQFLVDVYFVDFVTLHMPGTGLVWFYGLTSSYRNTFWRCFHALYTSPTWQATCGLQIIQRVLASNQPTKPVLQATNIHFE